VKEKRPTSKSVIEAVPELRGKLSENFYHKITSLLNRSKGASYEKMAAAVVISNAIEMLEIPEPEILLDRKEFQCFEEGNEKRRCDIFLVNQKIAYEIKSYRVCNCRFVREQICKDAWLLKNKQLEQVWWMLFQSATPSVLKSLTQNGIIYLDVLNDKDDFTNIPQLSDEHGLRPNHDS